MEKQIQEMEKGFKIMGSNDGQKVTLVVYGQKVTLVCLSGEVHVTDG